MIVVWLTHHVLDDPSERIDDAASRLQAGVENLDVRLPLGAQSVGHCIHEVKPKADYAPEEWLSLLRDAHARLILLGHALDKWCEEDFLPEFNEAIRRLATNGGIVDLVTLPEGGANTHRLSQQRHDDYDRRIQTGRQAIKTHPTTRIA